MVIARQKPRPWLVWLAAVVIVAAAVFVSLDEGWGTGALVLGIGAVPLAVYWYYKIRPWAEDPEVVAAAVRGIAGTIARGGRVSAADAAELREAEARARARAQEAARAAPLTSGRSR